MAAAGSHALAGWRSSLGWLPLPSEREPLLSAYPPILGSLVPWCLRCLWVSVGWVWVGLSRGLDSGGLLYRNTPRIRSAAAPVYFHISRPLTLCQSSGAADCRAPPGLHDSLAMNAARSGYRVFSANSTAACTELAKRITDAGDPS
ncbi:hypothetical protein AV530_003191 [Patagioenas fasciata monilis]|uniref:Uncharacterized protein n=1 Tax=Patagioenas fasciata monilis TaxID=372326 RepID=A0A1V4KWF4_PATFA|nr:hypothetical protein AV530_003191 [Patagioenas fasciata monilis]